MSPRRELAVSALIALIFVLGFLAASAIFPGGVIK